MRRALAASVGAVVGMMLLMPAAGAVEPPAVTAHGKGSTEGSFFAFDFNVAAGNTGHNPTGTITLNVADGAYEISGPPKCVAISGRRAIIGLSAHGTHGLNGVVVTAVDNGGPGSG